MGQDELRLVVRRSLADIEADIRLKAGIRGGLIEVSIEKDALVFTFEPGETGLKRLVDSQTSLSPPVSTPASSSPAPANRAVRRRRKRRVRRRTKTRGWDVVAKFENSKGQSCTIYRPMYEALSEPGLSRKQGTKLIREILEANGNDPSNETIDYYLSNTLEYIQKSGTQRTTSP